MSTESSSSKEDMSFPRDRSNFGSNSSYLPLRRTSQYQNYDYHSNPNENEEIENNNVDYGTTEFIDKFYKEFRNRNRYHYKNENNETNNQINDKNINEFCENQNFNMSHNFCFSTPKVPSETIQIPKEIKLHISKVVVLLSDLSSLNLNGKKVQSKYIHSWKNISQISTVEAKKILSNYYIDNYKNIVFRHQEVPAAKGNLNIATGKAKSTNILKTGQQYMASTKISNSPNSKQPKVSPNSSNFGSSVIPVQMFVKWTNEEQRNVFTKTNQFNSNVSINIFHYVGLGLSPPTEDSLYTLDSKYQKPTKMLISELNLTPPSLSIFDCDKAAILLDYFKKHDTNLNGSTEKCLFSAFFATSKSEQLRIPSNMPQNLFSCILLSPARAFSKITKIRVEDKSMFKMLLTIFTESIGLDSLPTETFYSIFRGEDNVSVLWQNFFLAQRLMHKYGLQSQSYPELKDMSEHQLWYQFEYAMMSHATLSNQNKKKETDSNSTKDGNDYSNDEDESDFDSITTNNSTGTMTNFVSNVKKTNSTNYISNTLVTSNPIINLSNMYCISFDTLENPPSYVTAFIASLIIVPELHANIMAKIARFMSKSPQNCVIMGKVLNYSIVCRLPEEDNEDIFVDWCCVMSGFLLAVPSLAAYFSKSTTSNDLIQICSRIIENRSKANKTKSCKNLNPENANISLFEKNSNSNTKLVRSSKLNKAFTKSSSHENLDKYNYYELHSDAICVYLLSIIVAVRDCHKSMMSFVRASQLEDFTRYIFTSSPILREWIVIFLHSSFTKCTPFLGDVGPIGIQTYSALLLYEKRNFTRAAALTVLTAMMSDTNISFDHTLMNCALKAAIDGSYIVRHAFLLCTAYYVELTNRKLLDENDDEDSNSNESSGFTPLPVNSNNDSSNYNEFNPGTDNQYRNEFVTINEEDTKINKIIDDFIKNDSEKFSKNSKSFKGIPKLKRLIQFLQKDPYPENSKLATMILNNSSKNIDQNSNSDSESDSSSTNSITATSILNRCQKYAVQIHRMAHTLLFSRRVDDRYSIRQRYCDNFFDDDELEIFELVDTNSGPIYTIAFDFGHKTFCTASINGEIVWGENRWKLGDDVVIESICPLRDLAWAAITNEGIVYILRDGQEEPVDEFRPSMREFHKQKLESQIELKSQSNTFNENHSNQQLDDKFKNSNSLENKKSPEIIHGVLCSSPDCSIVFISQGNNEILAWDIEALLLVGRIDVESPPKFMTLINGKLYVALMNGVVLQIGIKNASLSEKQSSVSAASTSESPSISSFVQAQNQNQNLYQTIIQIQNSNANENENSSDNEYDNYNYDEVEDNDGNDTFNENTYTSGDELILYVKKRNEKFKNKNILGIGNHKGLLYSVIDKGPLYFWEDFEFPRQITDDLTESPADFCVHPLYPVSLILNETPLLIQLYEDAPIMLKTKRNHKCTCCCFDGERLLCAIGYDDGLVAVWRIQKPKKETSNGD